jgi:hypothetical protein
MSEKLINLLIALREAQKEDEEKHTRGSAAERKMYEMRADNWIQNYMAEQVQMVMWTRGLKTDETPGVYNVNDDDEKKSGSCT